MAELGAIFVIFGIAIFVLVLVILFERLINDLSDESYEHQQSELQIIFVNEFKNQMEQLKHSLKMIERDEDKKLANQDVFRVFHTLKGDSKTFPSLFRFSQYVSIQTEKFRDLDESQLNNESLYNDLKTSFEKLSSLIENHRVTFAKFVNFTY